MTRPRFGAWGIQDYTVCAAGGSSVVYIDFEDTFYAQVAIISTYEATASSTGYTCKLYRGYYVDGEVTYTSSGDTIAIVTGPTASQGSTQTQVNDFALNTELYPRYLKMVIQNLDATNPFTFKVVGDR